MNLDMWVGRHSTIAGWHGMGSLGPPSSNLSTTHRMIPCHVTLPRICSWGTQRGHKKVHRYRSVSGKDDDGGCSCGGLNWDSHGMTEVEVEHKCASAYRHTGYAGHNRIRNRSDHTYHHHHHHQRCMATSLCPVLWSLFVPMSAWAEDGGQLHHYVPSPMETPSWEIWIGSLAGIVPFVIASYEFGKRIVIQRRCEACGGRGLVKKGKYWKKCVKVCTKIW